MAVLCDPGLPAAPDSTAPLDVRRQYLRRRRRPDLRAALAAVATVVGAVYALLVGVGLLLH